MRSCPNGTIVARASRARKRRQRAANRRRGLEGVRHPWLPVVDYGAVISSWRRCYVDLPPQTSTSGPYRPASRRDALAITSLLYIGCTVITNRCLTPSRATRILLDRCAQPAQAGSMPFMGTSPVPLMAAHSRGHCALHGYFNPSATHTGAARTPARAPSGYPARHPAPDPGAGFHCGMGGTWRTVAPTHEGRNASGRPAHPRSGGSAAIRACASRTRP